MTRTAAVAAAQNAFADGSFPALLARRVAVRSEGQDPAQALQLRFYLSAEIAPSLVDLGFHCELLENPIAGRGPFLVA